MSYVDRDLERRLMSDLNMPAMAAGKERSALEWKSVIDKTGLRYERIIPVADDLVSELLLGSRGESRFVVVNQHHVSHVVSSVSKSRAPIGMTREPAGFRPT
jgi:hypothetical protein